MRKSNVLRIIFIAHTRLRYTNILSSIFLSLVEMGHYVKDLDLAQNRGSTINPHRYQGGFGPVDIYYPMIRHEIEGFKPDIIILAGGGLTFTQAVSSYLKKQGITILGLTLSDPDVFDSVKNYAARFTYHTTNSVVAFERYRALGFNHTHYLPFGIDSRFFVPYHGIPEFAGDVVIIGHFSPSRFKLAEELRRRFNTRIFGSGWRYADAKPVAYPEWLKAVHSNKIVVDFPQTRAGYHNVKVRLFEVAATGKLIITEKLDEISDFFDYGSEIVGYENLDELFEKIEYFLEHDDEREKIGRKAQLKCAEQHMWKNRFQSLFETVGLSHPQGSELSK